MQNRLQSESGFATVIAMIMVGMLTLLGLAALMTADDETVIAGNKLQDTRSFYAAEGGLEMAAAKLQWEYDSTGIHPATMPAGVDTINQTAIFFTTTDSGLPAVQRLLTNGAMAGLNAQVKSYWLSSTAVSHIDHSKVEMSEVFEAALVPIFQFAVFYGEDLEVAPGPDMTLLGRVHSNGNLYIQAGNSLMMDSYVTASGKVLHGRKPGSGKTSSNGDVLIKDTDNNYVSMKEGTGWLEATDGHWYDSSVARWDGRVQDSAHGQQELNLPLTTAAGGDPHKIIERAGGNPDSYENVAGLKFIDRTAYLEVGGVWQDVTADMVSKGIISFANNQFTDRRESKQVDVMELDMDKLFNENYAAGVPYAPANGVVYYADVTGDYPALRLRNGSDLDGPLTVASENPVYTLGDYNSVGKQPAAILADAVNFLSNNWDDSKSHLSDLNQRLATTTTVNVSYLTGNVETAGGNYSGGFENLPRFLEKWSGINFNWKGSAVCLWESTQATGLWGKNSAYSPPIRNWAYDTDLDDPSNLPPESPKVRVFQRIGWQQQYVGY